MKHFMAIFFFLSLVLPECQSQSFEQVYKSVNKGIVVLIKPYAKTSVADSVFFEIEVSNQSKQGVLVSANELRAIFSVDSTLMKLDWGYAIADPLLMPKYTIKFKKLMPSETFTILGHFKTNVRSLKQLYIYYEAMFWEEIPEKTLRKIKRCNICDVCLKKIAAYEENDPSFRFMDVFDL
jgi:hypothetical protein